ncbi:hypothetical protein Tco_0472020 [Tanacetum coccineum]
MWKLRLTLEVARQSLHVFRLYLYVQVVLLGQACKSGRHCSYLSLEVKVASCTKYVVGRSVRDIRTSYVSRQCTSSDGDNAAPCLLRRLATPDWLLLAF